MGRGGSEEAGYCTFCCCSILLIVSVSLFGASFETLDPLHYAMRKNQISQAVDENNVYTSGRYFLGLNYNFLKFPSTLQMVEFPALSAASSEGQQVTLHVSFQYRLMAEDLFALFKATPTTFQQNYETVATTRLKEISTRYTITDYFRIRKQIAAVMHVELNTALRDHYAVVEHFQLKTVAIPASIDAQILQTLVAQQNVLITKAIQNSTVIRQETDSVVNRGAEASVIVIRAEADAEAEKINGQAIATGVTTHLNATRAAYTTLKAGLGYSSGQVLRHMYYEHLRTLEGSENDIYLDFPAALLNA